VNTGLDYKRLVQVMGMTGSVGDGEALNAMRLANRMLRAADLTWAEVLREPASPGHSVRAASWRTPPSKRKPGASYGQTVRRQRHSERNAGKHDDDDIQVMLAAVSSRRNTMNTMMFLSSLNDHWEKKGFLTTPQYEALKQMHRGKF
jgi:hypothetical protein